MGSIRKAAEAGDQVALLKQMRDRISDTLFSDETHPRDLASLSKRVQEIGKEIAILTGNQDDDAAQLKMLRDMRTHLSQAADDPKCVARDLATLTRRLQDISKDITTLAMRESKKGSTDGSASSSDNSVEGDQPFDIGQL